jgi:hypothetical protein
VCLVFVVEPRTICALYVLWNIELFLSLDVAWILCVYVLKKSNLCGCAAKNSNLCGCAVKI